MKDFFSRAAVAFLVLLIIFAAPGLFVKRANAVIATLPMQILDYALKAWNYIKEAYQYLESKMGMVSRDILAKKIIDYIVDETIKWVQGGGKPRFVTDWDGFVKEAGNRAFEQVVKDVGLARLCQPFSLQVKIGLLPVGRFGKKAECTLDRVVSNINNFYSNFGDGGWIAYGKAWEPNNNYFGQILMIQDEIDTKTSQETAAAVNEGMAGKGFLSSKKCLAYEEVSESELVACENESYDENGEMSLLLYEGCVARKKANAKCAKEVIQTPGDSVGAVVAAGLTSDIQWGANIQSWMSALVNAVINRLITEGLAGLQGSSQGGGGGSYYPSELAGQLNKELNKQKDEMIKSVGSLVNEWNYYLLAKLRSLGLARQRLESMTGTRCSTPPTQEQIDLAQADVDRLAADSGDLQQLIGRAEGLKVEVGNSTTTQAMMDSGYKMQAFLGTYYTPEMIQQIVDGSGRAGVDAETRRLQTNLDNANTCNFEPVR